MIELLESTVDAMLRSIAKDCVVLTKGHNVGSFAALGTSVIAKEKEQKDEKNRKSGDG